MPNLRAKELRREATDAERKLWSLLRDHGVDGHKFRRQHPIGRYIADFACVCSGIIDVPIYSTLTADQTAYLLAHSGARVAFVSGRATRRRLVPIQSGRACV